MRVAPGSSSLYNCGPLGCCRKEIGWGSLRLRVIGDHLVREDEVSYRAFVAAIRYGCVLIMGCITSSLQDLFVSLCFKI